MFRKLISNLPFNPSLIGEVAFYYKRLQREEKLRRVGVMLVVLSFFIQTFAIISPPQATLAESANDIIRGGFQNRDQATLHCLGDTQGFRDILAFYGLSCDDVAAAQTVSLRSTDYAGELDSMGRQSKGPVVTRTNKITEEYSVAIGGTTFWMRNLWSFDSGPYSTYTALKMQNNQGKPIFILYNCGNIVTVGPYKSEPPEPTPTPTPENQPPTASFAANCSGISWRAYDPQGAPRIKIYITKKTNDANADWVFKGGAAYTIEPPTTAPSTEGTKEIPDIIKQQTDSEYRVFVTASDKKPDGVISDAAAVRAKPTDGVVFGPCSEAEPTPPPTPPTPTTTVDACPLLAGTQASTLECDVCENIGGIQYTYAECDVCENIPGTQSNSNECYPCPEAENDNAITTCLELDKSASNLTQNIENADGTQAAPNDVIAYTLSVKNKGNQAVADFQIKEDMTDVLQYSTLTDADGGTLDGDILTWPAESIAAGQTLSKTITVKVDPQIHSTPMSTSDPSSYDLVMNNVFYGNAVNISLPTPIGKTAETAVTTLPKTGPAESMITLSLVAIIVSYFLARAHLLRKETQLVRAQFVEGSY